jgi:hypothetical protein
MFRLQRVYFLHRFAKVYGHKNELYYRKKRLVSNSTQRGTWVRSSIDERTCWSVEWRYSLNVIRRFREEKVEIAEKSFLQVIV